MTQYSNIIRKPSVRIIVATHKKYKMPEDNMYLPLHVGAEGKVSTDGLPLDLGYQRDNTGENISNRNAGFCELTGLYWAWKNLDEDYIGVVHYRRYFGRKDDKNNLDKILSYDELKVMVNTYKIFVPRKRKYYIESLYSHYKHTHYCSQLDTCRNIIEKMYPEYVECFDKIVNRTYGYMFNMMIMEKKYLDQYCTWLFNILFEMENELKQEKLSVYQGRFYGRISEIIFNVWLQYQIENGEIKLNEIKELPYFHVEKIDWWKKGMAFIKAKFGGKRYERSF